MNEATTAKSSGKRNVARSSHRLAVAGRKIKVPALTTDPANSAHPMNAFAEYQMSMLDRVTLVLKP
jgi:hypothetical protein